ncbi:hypothetical protein ABIC20_002907 [Methylobacterium radiotolerans]|uniref:Uncharacterized protein n=1 Tax=Methylobacterium radiotolerans TaxID=31998 RepID=A0ABV2NGH4_9HYPH
MSFEPIGAITVVVGLFCLLLGRESVVIAFVVFCNLGSAAALLLGGANVQPAHLFLVFLMIATLFYRNISTLVLSSFRLPEAGFWLLCLTLYGVASSYILPRLFAGQTYIVPLGTSSHLITSDGVGSPGPGLQQFHAADLSHRRSGLFQCHHRFRIHQERDRDARESAHHLCGR